MSMCNKRYYDNVKFNIQPKKCRQTGTSDNKMNFYWMFA